MSCINPCFCVECTYSICQIILYKKNEGIFRSIEVSSLLNYKFIKRKIILWELSLSGEPIKRHPRAQRQKSICIWTSKLPCCGESQRQGLGAATRSWRPKTYGCKKLNSSNNQWGKKTLSLRWNTSLIWHQQPCWILCRATNEPGLKLLTHGNTAIVNLCCFKLLRW